MTEITDEMREAVIAVLEDNGLLIDEHEPDQIIAAVAPLIEAQARAEVERLNEAIKRQASAVKTLQACEDREIAGLRKTDRSAHVAIQTLDSEREANAALTAENDALRAELAQARAAAMEEAAKRLETMASLSGAQAARAIRALASRPVSEREGEKA